VNKTGQEKGVEVLCNGVQIGVLHVAGRSQIYQAGDDRQAIHHLAGCNSQQQLADKFILGAGCLFRVQTSANQDCATAAYNNVKGLLSVALI
jgi:hypothetical protein